MSARVFRYQFDSQVPIEEVESSLLLAILATESLHGETDVQLNVIHTLDTQRRICVIDAGSDVGRSLNKIFAGFLRREFGRDQFTVRRLYAPVNEQPQANDHVG